MTRSVQSVLLVLVSMAAGLVLAAPASAITFDAAVTYAPAGGGVNGDQSLAIGDVNGDGHPDVVSAAKTGSNVTVLTSVGDGTFTTSTRAVSSGANDLALADVNRDGRLDLVTATVSGIVPMVGDGSGGFTAQGGTASPTITGIAVGDVDHDGLPDVAATAGGGDVRVFRGTAGGGFAAPQSVASTLTSGEMEIQLADLNRDGDLDVVLATGDRGTLVQLGDGAGGFAAPVAFSTVDDTLGAALVDANRDAKLDLLLVGPDAPFAIARGNGDGTFTAQPAPPAEEDASIAVTGDLDRDGRADLVAAGGGGLTLVRGISDDTFSGTQTNLIAAPLADAGVADFDGDGRLDVAAAGTDGGVRIALNTTPFATPNVFAAPDGPAPGTNSGPGAVTVGDLNRDGIPDLAVAQQTASRIGIFLGNGDGTYAARGDYWPGGNSPGDVKIVDVNRDGVPDLVTNNALSASIGVMLGNGDGTFATATTADVGLFTGPSDIAVTDFNGDGKLDVVTSNADGQNVSVFLGNGDGTFLAGVRYSGYGGLQGITTGDFNRDGKSDVAAITNDRVNIFLGNGDGTLQAVNSDTRLPSFGTGWSIETDDLNRDGLLDLVTASYGSSQLSFLPGNGDGTFGTRADHAVTGNPRALAIGDVTSDGQPDLVTTNGTGANMSILPGNGDGTFGAERTSPLQTGSYGVAVGDLDRDGTTDAVASLYTIDTLAVRLAGNDTLAPDTTDNVSANWYVSARATVTLTATDLGGAGGATTYYTTGVSPATPTTASAVYTTASKPQLSDGEKISYFSVDAVGNAEAVKTSAAVRVDATRPVTSDDVPSTWQRGAVEVTLSASDAGSGVARTHYTTGTNPSNPSTASPLYNPASKPSLANGQRIRYFTIDAAGNRESAKTSIAARVDAATPVTTLGAVPDAFTSDVRPAVAFSTTADEATFECSLDDDPFAACSSPFTPSADLADGPHELRVRAIGRTGAVEASPATAGFTVDTLAPVAPALVSGPPASAEATTATVEFSGEGAATFACGTDGAAATACSSPLGLRDLAVGDHVVEIVQTDRAGNHGAALTVRFTVVAPEQRRDDTPRDGADQPRDGNTPPGGDQPRDGETPPGGGDQPRGGETPPGGGDQPRGGETAPSGNEQPRGGDVPPGGGSSAPVEPTAILPRVGGHDGARADVVFAGVTTVVCQPNAGTIVACELTARSVREIRTADRRTLPAGTVLAQGVAQRSPAGLATKRLTLTSAGRSALINHPLGRAARLVLSARTASGRVVVSETTIRLRFLAGQSLTIRYPGRGTALPQHVRDALQRLVRAVSPVTSVLCIADTDPSGDARADLALTRAQAKRACDYLGARGLKGKRSSAGRGATRPRASNGTSAGRALNRRLTLRIAP